MRKVNTLAATLMLSIAGGAFIVPQTAFAKGQCPIDQRKSQAVGQSVGKKVQRSFKAYQDGALDQAISILLEVKAKDDFDKAYVARMLGNFYAEKGNMSTALKYLKQAADANILGGADHGATLRLYADLLLQEKKFKDAIPYYYQWMEFTCKEDATVYRRIGIAYSEQKQWNKVLEVANKGLKIAESPDKNLYQMKLTAYYNKKQYKNAVTVLEEMVPLFSDDKRLWVQLAQFYLLIENYDKSLATYDLAYKQGYLETEGNFKRLAQLLAQKGSPYKAAKLFQKHLDAGDIKNTKESIDQLARFYHQAKEIQTAAKYYGQAAAMDDDGEIYLKQGRLLAMLEQQKPAISAFKKALAAGLKNPGEADFELALAYLGLKQYKSAYTYAQRAAKDSKTDRKSVV